ncbi:PAS domain S-box-containing protein [Roseateles sp. YR242]|uniref:ATP-binding protein n=1 Tax=Roseateles sp. YR242 TaxID=1855305 RepID=UPI0008D1D104|nr:ATP-binding protein [Roseateles sp. YR242]SEK77201.1 PAS domain S-box-containing protein [Roseateles sp. YR242]
MSNLAPAVQSLQRLRSATLVAGIVLAIASTVAVVAPILVQRHAALEEARGRGVLLAQMLEADATRTVESVSVTLHGLADSVPLAGGGPEEGGRKSASQWSDHMNRVLLGLPFLRSIAVLDSHGRVLASTNADEVGLEVPMQRMERLPAPDRDQLQPLQPGRTLADLVNDGTVRPATVSMLPMLLQLPEAVDRRPAAAVDRHPALAADRHSAPTVSGRAGSTSVRGAGMARARAAAAASPPARRDDTAPRWLLALINPEALAQLQQQALPLNNSAAWLASPTGQLLAALETLPELPGQYMSGHPVFDRLRTGPDHGSYFGAGALPGELIVAYRASPRRGLVISVEQSQVEVLGPWRSSLWGPVMTGVLALCLIASATIIVRRSLLARADAVAALQQAHEQLADRERDMRVLLRSVQELIFRTDLQGTLTFVNARWTTLHRGRVDEAVGRRLADLADQEDRAAVEALFHHREGPRSTEATIRNGEGEPRRYLIAIVPLRRDGGRGGYAGSAVDVTERARAERLSREARDAAQEASRIKTEFLANISHELRTPLQSILGFSELGVGRSEGAPRLRAMFEDIHGSGQRMLSMVNDLLDVSKLESSIGAFALERYDLRELVRDVVHELEPLRIQRYLDLQVHLETPLPVRVDPVRIQQAIRNLLANAIKFAPSGSAIDITGTVEEPSGELRLCVADRGPGIPVDELERIFDAFVQSSATKDGSGGTGLGLAISRRIVEIHGGRLYAANRPGGGAEFHLVLPPRHLAEHTDPRPPGSAHDPGPAALPAGPWGGPSGDRSGGGSEGLDTASHP